jgi:hypothetical protein
LNSDQVALLENNGDGTFEAAVYLGVGDEPRSVFAADLDGDYDQDLAVANFGSDNVSILFNQTDVPVDSDGDGYRDDVDCDINDPDTYPGATEVWYDGSDRNCDGMNDYDQDTDGFVHEDYDAQAGGSAPGVGDCVDTDDAINPDATEIIDDGIDQDCNGTDAVTCYVDIDLDGYGGDDATVVIAVDGSCDTPEGESYTFDDCWDLNDKIYPGATEVWYDGSDGNCDGLNDYDQDFDGYVHEDHDAQAGGSASGTDDCDDTDDSINPDATEIIDDGIDQDCDGEDLVSTCCAERVGDANGLGTDDPTIGDVSVMIDAKFIAGVCVVDEGLPTENRIIDCLTEADINQSGGLDPTCDDISIGDISILIDYLFIGGPSVVILPDCL